MAFQDLMYLKSPGFSLSALKPSVQSRTPSAPELFLLYESIHVHNIAWEGNAGLLRYEKSGLESDQIKIPVDASSKNDTQTASPSTKHQSILEKVPKEIEAIIRLLAASTSLQTPSLLDLWPSRMQLSTALAGENHPFKRHNSTSQALSTFEFSSLVLLQNKVPSASREIADRRALVLDAELDESKHWHGIAEQYGKSIIRSNEKQDVNPAYLIVFQHNGKVYGLTGSILAYERAFKAINARLGLDTHHSDPMHYEALANIYLKKYEKWRGRADLDRGISSYRDCLKKTEDTDIHYVARVTALSYTLQLRATMYKSLPDIIEAQRLLKRTVKYVNNANLQDQGRYNSMLSLVNFASWTLDKDSMSYDDIIQGFLEITQNGFIDSEIIVNALYLMRLVILQQPPMESNELYKARLDTLHDLARVLSSVLSVMTDQNPTRLTVCKLAADLYLWLYNETRHEDYGGYASQLYSELYSDVLADPETRIQAAYFSASFYISLMGNVEAAFNAVALAYSLLPEVVSEALNRQDQLQILRKLWHIPSFVTAVALEADYTADKALRLLEHGRGFLWDNLLNERVPIQELYQKQAVLAIQYEHLRRMIKSKEGVTPKSKEISLDSRYYTSRLSDLLTKIREQDGFNDFLRLPSDVEELEELGKYGPIIAVNVSTFRSDALIITATGIVSHTLAELTLRACEQKIAEYQAAVVQIKFDPSKAEAELLPILKWLWEVVAEPILNALLIFPNTKATPHIWWLTTGPINVLPIHAAGDHERARLTGDSCTLIDRAICSYAPTLRALEYARKKQEAYSQKSGEHKGMNLLLVPMPKTPNMAELEYAAREADIVESIFTASTLQERVQVTRLTRPRCIEVIEALRSSTVAHFACHAKVNDLDPSKSHLRLQDWGSAPLDVATLMELDLSCCQLAYLSACETAVNKDAELQDEGIHISGGFQMGGVPNTIATWWEVEDRYPSNVAAVFYRTLAQDGRVDFSQCAASLRASILALRDIGIGPLTWGAYIHYGV